jgi:hypothetical protein
MSKPVLRIAFVVFSAVLLIVGVRCFENDSCQWLANFGRNLVFASRPALQVGCGTDASGNPTDDSQCGASGTNSYSSENATDLVSWCGGKLPGTCTPVPRCGTSLSSGKTGSHKKYYVASDLNCGPTSLAFQPANYTDLNLNGRTVVGVIFSNGFLRGFHLFNGTLNCNVGYPSKLAPGAFAYGCVDEENNGGSFQPGGGDTILIHHISGQNASGHSYFMRFTGAFKEPAHGWNEYSMKVFNSTFQSVSETDAPRQHAGMYSETQPVEYYNNLGNCGGTGPANACQLLELYSSGKGSYIHNNKLTCEPFNIKDGDSCRQILVDGGINAHVQYNDLYPANNRAIRLRDALGAEVDHNFIHQMTSANGYAGHGIHTGDNDINSGQGQTLGQRIHNNIFELGENALAISVVGQRAFMSDSDTFMCYSAGCAGAQIMLTRNAGTSFGYPVTVNAATKTITQASGNFSRGTSLKPDSLLSFGGFSQPGNDQVFAITSVTPTVLTLSDPKNELVDEVSRSAQYAGVAQSALYNPIIIGDLIPQVTVYQALPTAKLEYCGASVIKKNGNGAFVSILPPCPTDGRK